MKIFGKIKFSNLNTKDLKNLEPLEDKWNSFGWDTHRINGHSMDDITNTLSLPIHANKPRIIIADTIKGKGVSFMENKLLWHYKSPNDKELQIAIKNLF